MNKLYETILALCEERGITVYKMCKEIEIRGSVLSDLNCGRKESLSAKTLSRIAEYFHVSVDYLLGSEQEKKPLINDDEELTEYLDELRSRPEKRMLFSVTKNATKAQIEAIVKMIEEMKGD